MFASPIVFNTFEDANEWVNLKYSRLRITRTFKLREIEKRFELSGVRVIASSKKIAAR